MEHFLGDKLPNSSYKYIYQIDKSQIQAGYDHYYNLVMNSGHLESILKRYNLSLIDIWKFDLHTYKDILKRVKEIDEREASIIENETNKLNTKTNTLFDEE